MSNFSTIHSFTQKWEGGVSNHKNDSGGLTAYGASTKFVQGLTSTKSGSDFLQSIGVGVPVTIDVMKNLTKEQVTKMFKREFWDKCLCEKMPFPIAACVYDAAVNCGCGSSAKFLQRALNLTSKKAEGLLAVDGAIGPKTLSEVLTRCVDDKECKIVSTELISQRKKYYDLIVQSNKSQSVFLKGWTNRVNDLSDFIEGYFK